MPTVCSFEQCYVSSKTSTKIQADGIIGDCVSRNQIVHFHVCRSVVGGTYFARWMGVIQSVHGRVSAGRRTDSNLGADPAIPIAEQQNHNMLVAATMSPGQSTLQS